MVDTSIIDELYEIYKNENMVNAETKFMQYYYKYQLYGKKDLIDNIKEFIQQQTSVISSNFISNKDESYLEHNLVKDIEYMFESLVMPVDFLLLDFVHPEDEDEKYVDPNEPIFNLKPHDLFNMRIEFIDQAVEKYGKTYEDGYKQIRDLIIYVKKHKVLDKIYKDKSWHEIDFQELLYSIYDFVKDKSIFNINFSSLDEEETLFQKIKTNCIRKLSGNFDKYRPNLNSSKQIRADFGKLIFCKNLLMFYDNGRMPDFYGFIDWSVEELEHMDMLENFKKLYSKNFDETSFREKQSNLICNPDIYADSYKLDAGRKVKKDNKMIFGYIISCSHSLGSANHCYLIHIQIDDVNNSCSNYEMQVSLLPQGDFDRRLQLMRLDNWQSEQPHKNVSRKLATTTHIHLYNEFDLLRGKTNGAFDIAYNIEGTSTEFETSLRTFLSILDLGADVTKSIYEKTMKNLCVCKEIKEEKVIK